MFTDTAEEQVLLLQDALFTLWVEGGKVDVLHVGHRAAGSQVLLYLPLVVDSLEVRRFTNQLCG